MPTVDCFAQPDLHQCPVWWGPGSVHGVDAFTKNWGKVGLLWMNPSFSRMHEVLRKIAKDKARAILLMPHWEERGFPQAAAPMVLKAVLFPEGSCVFQTTKGEAGPTKWPMWALLLDGSHRGACQLTEDGPLGLDIPTTESDDSSVPAVPEPVGSEE